MIQIINQDFRSVEVRSPIVIMLVNEGGDRWQVFGYLNGFANASYGPRKWEGAMDAVKVLARELKAEFNPCRSCRNRSDAVLSDHQGV